jgi:peptidoglycan/xylan/chitin deacetylase (PgdA/CDA1 family)
MARYRKTARLVRSLGLESAAHRLAGSLCEVDTVRPVFHLTFDDGPHPEVTPRLLGLLDEHKAPATFFLLTDAAQRHPDLVHEIIDRGHEIGHHSRTHLRLSTAPLQRLSDEIRAAKRDLEEVAGKKVTLFRPPYGAHGLRSLYMSRLSGMETVLWSVDSEDWKGLTPEAPLAHAAGKLRAGGILLLHDTPVGESVTKDTEQGLVDKVDLTAMYLDELADKALTPVSLKELKSGGDPVLRAKVAK